MIKYKITNRLLLALFLLLIIVSAVFAYSHKVSEDIIRGNLESATKRQLEFSIERLEKDIKLLETLSILLINDHSIKSYANSEDFKGYVNHLLQKKYIEEKLTIQRYVNKFYNDITVYWPQTEEVISTSGEENFDAAYLVDSPKNKWFLTNTDNQLTFHFQVTNPYSQKNLHDTITIVETTFTSDYLATVLETLDASGNTQSFFHFKDSTIFANHSVDKGILSQLENGTSLENRTKPMILEIDGDKYSVQTSESPLINATLVSYIALDDFLSPLNKAKYLVYTSLILLFLTGLVMTLLFYRYLRFNLNHLVDKIEQLGRGNYNSRVTIKTDNEFDFLFKHFNNMAQRIQSLIEDVYEEKIRTSEAEYKHLQSQINPHFLYNCLFYIVSMAKRSPSAVISMADNLAKYYRYITKKTGSQTTLQEEINLIENYLNVQSLRNKRIQYSIDIPESMDNLVLPPLTIQPIVENAIIHGIDQKKDSGKIAITGKTIPNGFELIIEDDGVGLPTGEINQLISRLDEKMNMNEMGYGLWNIHQRLKHQFGSCSGLVITTSRLGGLSVAIYLVTTAKNKP